MKAKLIFDLNDHDDRLNYMQCIKGRDMSFALFEITHNLKKKCERVVDDMDGLDALDYIFDEIFKELDRNNINIDEIVN